MFPLRILPAGDAALVVELPQQIDERLNAWCISLASAVERLCGTAVRDVVVGYCTVTVYFDPLAVESLWLEDQIRLAGAGLTSVAEAEGALIDVPVSYGGELGPDLRDVAAFGHCDEQEAVARHTARTYRVYLVGFVPGFAYMAEVDPQIAAPRRTMPRTAVPAGSVAIAGGQTGIYPTVTPGGWNIIGRTPLKPFDPSRRDPFLFKPGDRVQFHPIDRSEYQRVVGERAMREGAKTTEKTE